MSKQCSGATDLKALSLQMSRAFARDALTSAANHRFSMQLSATQGTTVSGGLSRAAAAPASLHTSAVDGSVTMMRYSQGFAGRSANQPADRSAAARLGLVSALSFYQEGSIGPGSGPGPSEVAVSDASASRAAVPGTAASEPFHGNIAGLAIEMEGAESPVFHSFGQKPLQAPQSLTPSSPTPSTPDVLRAQVEQILAGSRCAVPGVKFLEKFGSRMILTYLMRVCSSCLMAYNVTCMYLVSLLFVAMRLSVAGHIHRICRSSKPC
jgi:hypothetical protein